MWTAFVYIGTHGSWSMGGFESEMDALDAAMSYYDKTPNATAYGVEYTAK